MRIVTFGLQPTAAPPGNFREIHFPQLARLDSGTREMYLSRLLTSDGANARNLPRTIYFQLAQTGGHDGAIAVGSLHEITANGETGILSGKGWISDTPEGRMAAAHILAKSMFHNSVDLADLGPESVELIEHGDFWDDDWFVEARFVDWSVGATTIVGKPAFADAHGVFPDEITAALEDDTPLVVDCPGIFTSHSALEVTASMANLPPYDYFARPESDIPHKIMVSEPDEHGWCAVYGHLARWGHAHTGYDGVQIYAQRSANDYATFCQPSVLTDRGLVRTGPIVLYGGHISLKDACDDPKNAWADVRVIDGRHGPWVCGVARPNVTHEAAERYVARASRISGHWKAGDLRMIISCNAEGHPIAFHPGMDEVVASFEVDQRRTVTIADLPAEVLSFTELPPEVQGRIREAFAPTMSASTTVQPASLPDDVVVAVDLDPEFDAEAAHRARMRELELEAETHP